MTCGAWGLSLSNCLCNVWDFRLSYVTRKRFKLWWCSWIYSFFFFPFLFFSFRCTVKNRPINIQTALWKSTLKLTPELWTHNCLSHFLASDVSQHIPTRFYGNNGKLKLQLHVTGSLLTSFACAFSPLFFFILLWKSPNIHKNSWSIVYQSNNIKRAATVGILRCCRCACVCFSVYERLCVQCILY